MSNTPEPQPTDFLLCGLCDKPLTVVLYAKKPWLFCDACRRLHLVAPVRVR